MNKVKLWNSDFELHDTGYNRGEFNMNWDIEAANSLIQSGGAECFRLYAWEPWCVSLGYNQKSDGISEEKCKTKGIEIVRRPTGGRAVLHADELTYSIIMKLDEKLDRHKVYKDIHLFFIKVFAELGADLDYVRNSANLNQFYKDSDLSFACFASSAKYEVTFQNKKIVGSAQRVYGDVLLQHGSILLGNGHEILPDLLPTNDENTINRAKAYLKNEATTLSEACGKSISYDECALAISNSLLTNGIIID